MKKFFTYFFMICAFVLSSCSKDDDNENPTTYTFEYNYSGTSNLVTTDIMFFEYNNSNETIKSFGLTDCKFGLKKVFTADDNASKVKVYIKWRTPSFTDSKWINQVYYLKNKSNIKIALDENTIISTKEP
jgi:hypothetical protein